ncbi:uncharacterized protein LOC123531623 isoform X2 [Mercenaria mercenaria]|uniref:uncharacterized protein LOC123531623 isoform X2 n=1 Tax=Mercenaria mercenaria TaxID=6596 RepID=UPI001E1DB4BA|nr:uncharacterized protein LOC123531623 isoform X2 [Mercenaria mercenaria]
MMEFKSLTFILLVCVLATNGQRYYGGGYDCPTMIRCALNPCRTGGHNCPNYPNAVCINDDPCQPFCIGHYYIGRQRRLTTEECHGDPPQVECPNRPQMRCFRNPCHNARCPAYPEAECRNDDPCEPFCVGHFYLPDGTQLRRRDCRRGNRRRHRGGRI